MTGYATLTVIVKDINDNFPQFLKDYQPQVMEGEKVKFPQELVEIFARDPDTPRFGAPFGFATPQCSDGSYRCPCENRPTCDKFDLVFNPGEDFFI